MPHDCPITQACRGPTYARGRLASPCSGSVRLILWVLDVTARRLTRVHPSQAMSISSCSCQSENAKLYCMHCRNAPLSFHRLIQLSLKSDQPEARDRMDVKLVHGSVQQWSRRGVRFSSKWKLSSFFSPVVLKESYKPTGYAAVRQGQTCWWHGISRRRRRQIRAESPNYPIARQ